MPPQPTPKPTWTLDRTIPSDPDLCAGIIAEIVDALQAHDWADRDVFGIHMAMEEAIQNAIRHGNRCDASKSVAIQISVTSEQFTATVTDQGEGFDPDQVPDPTLDCNLERCSGRGLVLINKYADEMVFNAAGNSLRISKRKSESAAAGDNGTSSATDASSSPAGDDHGG